MYTRFAQNIFLLLFFGLLPIITFAALNAGVVDGVWFSTSNPKAGEPIKIFTAVQNQSNETIKGNVSFLVNSKIIGSTKFTVRSNEIKSVSIDYTFSGGNYEVSAYITSVKEQNVVYTIVPKTSISVQTKSKDVAKENDSKIINNAPSTLLTKTEKIINSGKNIISKMDPVTESLAQKIETFRNKVISEKAPESNIKKIATKKTKDTNEIQEIKKFIDKSKTILSTKKLPIWNKILGITLSILALLLRLWFVLVVFILGIFFWSLIRGRRIR